MNWNEVCKKYVGMKYDADKFNCRHLAAYAFTDLTGYDATSIFAVGGNEGKLKKLARSDFKSVKIPSSELCVVISRSKYNQTHVALKHGNEVLHNFGLLRNGQVCISRWETFQRGCKDIRFWMLK